MNRHEKRKAEKFGPTGEFPDGKLHTTDNGELRIGMANYKDRVVVKFGVNLSWFGLTKRDAIEFIKLMQEHVDQLPKADDE